MINSLIDWLTAANPFVLAVWIVMLIYIAKKLDIFDDLWFEIKWRLEPIFQKLVVWLYWGYVTVVGIYIVVFGMLIFWIDIPILVTNATMGLMIIWLVLVGWLFYNIRKIEKKQEPIIV